MAAVGIAFMAIMMGGMLLMHLGKHGHSGHDAKAAASVEASSSAAPGGDPHDHRDNDKRHPEMESKNP